METNALLLAPLPLLATTCTSVEQDPLGAISAPESDNPPHAFRTIICLACSHEINFPVYCGDRWCPICSVQRSMRIRDRIVYCISHQPRLSGATFKHLTLTIKNSENLAEQARHLIDSFRRLRQRKFFKNSIIGGAFVMEITGKIGEWHAHIHAIIYSYFMPWEKLYRLWLKVSGGKHIHIGMISPFACAKYLTKYVSKGCDIEKSSRTEANEALKHYRLFNPFAAWHHLSATWKPERPGCPKCGHHDFLPLDFIESCNKYDYAFIMYTRKGWLSNDVSERNRAPA